MIAGECEDIRRRCGRRLRRGFVHSHGCGSNAKSCDCTASGKLVDRHTSLPSDDHYICGPEDRSEEHTSELQTLMRTSYAVFCLTKKTSLILLMYTIHCMNN